MYIYFFPHLLFYNGNNICGYDKWYIFDIAIKTWFMADYNQP